ncbi:hypothetical protein GCM10023324_45650 [Streptomyces youssoufiensis]
MHVRTQNTRIRFMGDGRRITPRGGRFPRTPPTGATGAPTVARAHPVSPRHAPPHPARAHHGTGPRPPGSPASPASPLRLAAQLTARRTNSAIRASTSAFTSVSA